jgi:VWFA-related protein
VHKRCLWLLAAMSTIVAGAASSSDAQNRPALPETSVRLTSPLGRTGFTGTIRIVAQVVTPAPGGILPVRFLVDGKPLKEDVDGAPYVAEWVDENPYEKREISVEVDDGLSGVVRDRVVLEPLEVVEETSVASVLVETIVTDKTGRAIATLAANDFTLHEDAVRQTLDLAQLQRLPTTFTLLVDSSQSMARRIDLVRKTARRLSSRLQPGDMVAVAPFRRGVESFTGPTNDAATIAEAILAVRAEGGTAIADSLAELPAMLPRGAGRNVVILVTDGYDEHSEKPVNAALEALKQLYATVYVIGIGGVAGISLKGELLLRQVAAQTGGRALFPSREEQLPEVHEAIAADVYSRYLLTYTPTNQVPDGTYRTIRVDVADPSYKVVARKGYTAPRPPPIRPTIEFSATAVEPGAAVALGAADLTVTEDGVAQRVESFQEANAPISIVLAMDASGSIKPALQAVKDAALSFVGALRADDPLALVQFSDDVVFAHDFSTKRQLSLDAIAAHRALGGTALWDALHGSMALLQRQEGRRAVVVVTDGRDENNPGTGPGSTHTVADALARAQESDTTVYAIGIGPRVDRDALQRIADISGGAAYFPDDVSTLSEQYQRIIEDLRRRYLLTYTSTNSKRDGAWREVAITATQPGITIRSRGGYTAPEVAAAASPQPRER